MSCPISPAMIEARRLITEQGYNQYQAAKQAGITRSAISQSAWYREHVKACRVPDAVKLVPDH